MAKMSQKDFIDYVSNNFSKLQAELKFSMDDGGSVADFHVIDEAKAKQIRDIIPLKCNGWRTCVVFTGVTPEQAAI